MASLPLVERPGAWASAITGMPDSEPLTDIYYPILHKYLVWVTCIQFAEALTPTNDDPCKNLFGETLADFGLRIGEPSASISERPWTSLIPCLRVFV